MGEYAGLKFLVSYQDGCKLMFQRIFSGSVYENNTFLTFPVHEQPQLRTDDRLIVINKEPDAIYHITENRLYFKYIPTVKPLFPGIEALYKEATNQEVSDCLELDLMKLGGGLKTDHVKTLSRGHGKEGKEIGDG